MKHENYSLDVRGREFVSILTREKNDDITFGVLLEANKFLDEINSQYMHIFYCNISNLNDIKSPHIEEFDVDYIIV